MDKKTVEGINNLEFTARAADLPTNDSDQQNAELTEKQQTVEGDSNAIEDETT
jgi:hypothetical protein